MRGAEEMYLPLDDPQVDSHWSPEELAALKKKELEDALKRVHEGLLHWVRFFENSPKYPKVGYLKRPKNWLDNEPRRPLCVLPVGLGLEPEPVGLGIELVVPPIEPVGELPPLLVPAEFGSRFAAATAEIFLN
ncbi:hypothetical protein NUW58_g10859 [Xylaria curta]|uniref:Uncharacterized protein n=1 Tax=Xylaria curta TaxID=42375 RepID=A0ACC1MGX2_9PEZI|nr:hypothetical protein NUW58_g10859 [Xylaria curta]